MQYPRHYPRARICELHEVAVAKLKRITFTVVFTRNNNNLVRLCLFMSESYILLDREIPCIPQSRSPNNPRRLESNTTSTSDAFMWIVCQSWLKNLVEMNLKNVRRILFLNHLFCFHIFPVTKLDHP